LSGRLIASLLGAVGVTLWATETTLINLAPTIPPLQVVALAFGFASLMMPIVWKLTGESPFVAFRLPKRVWLLMVVSLVGYHSCIYYATQRAPAAPAALLQGTTPLLIVLGSAFLPGERLRWWHIVGAILGFAGISMLIGSGEEGAATGDNPAFYLSLIGIAAGLWGLYSVVTRSLTDVPTSALGMFYAASALVAFAAHLVLEPWVTPTASEWLAIAGLGLLPMGLAIYLWDFGLKRGDIQALGAFSYTEPFIGAVLVAVVTQATLGLNLLWSGLLITAGAIVASASLWKEKSPDLGEDRSEVAMALNATTLKAEISRVGRKVLDRLLVLEEAPCPENQREREELAEILHLAIWLWDALEDLEVSKPAPKTDLALAA
jgi:drug/metabolite transporter (DMT)-like permease